MQPWAVPDVAGHVVSRLSLADADEWAEFATLPEVQRHTSSSVASVADLVPMIERSLAATPDAPVLFAVRARATAPSAGEAADRRPGELVATAGFHTVSALNRTAEITYTVRPRHWGQGLATLICNAGARWAFDVRRWVRVQATTLEPNLASQRVLQKCGFQLEGRLRNFRIVCGEPRDYLLFARVPDDRPASLRSA